MLYRLLMDVFSRHLQDTTESHQSRLIADSIISNSGPPLHPKTSGIYCFCSIIKLVHSKWVHGQLNINFLSGSNISSDKLKENSHDGSWNQ